MGQTMAVVFGVKNKIPAYAITSYCRTVYYPHTMRLVVIPAALSIPR
jgi:hypothetical protein